MAKIAIKSEKITPFGGIFHVMDQFSSVLEISPLWLKSVLIIMHKSTPIYKNQVLEVLLRRRGKTMRRVFYNRLRASSPRRLARTGRPCPQPKTVGRCAIQRGFCCWRKKTSAPTGRTFRCVYWRVVYGFILDAPRRVSTGFTVICWWGFEKRFLIMAFFFVSL